ncbi:DUF2752 domain-containing protein [Capnocytophaga genosp. AHN8471]|uniref:DUF2752 domain-containing protein n=1 Tax=Capnocytophaga genosp. AHN8471 TaxID=327574 RepID=A0ABS1YVC9_9FLAO|nr:DUF2752 domain-containing protein [Capnocytophaga genosp. AHN8471]MBM0650369.1 DUF2752 domain-containing protein [Capnocytophaga genosp. AHN8471]MBM0662235.1 DUF2752 domain-containing protein [Capnocytophaga genosp. AHN8471]
MKLTNSHKYLLVNSILIALFFGGILYLKYFPAKIQCYYKSHYGFECPTCGLTRDFSQFLSLDFHSPLNPASYYYFTAFTLIFVTRILHSLIVYRKPHQLKSIIFLDGVVLVFSIFVVVLGFL